ncbi:sensor histidine kinase [Paenibacillus hubeiensis]|uniref:sensor histidine kinase n=1 Tax=Paenibacillus hubeiensis TaxID=3077330 RepID=UPI0031BA3894
MRNWFRNENVQMSAVALATAVGAQFRIYPFREDVFRIGLGVSIFLLLLMILPNLPYLKTGIMTGAASFAFQTGDWLLQKHDWSILEGVLNNIGAGMYYIVFAWMLSKLKYRFNELQPLLLGGMIAVIDFSSNLVELLFRGVLVGSDIFSIRGWLYLLVVACLRSYFVIGLYSSITVRQMRLLHAEQEKRMEQMLSVDSGLYGEVFYLKKSMKTIESIAADSYELYRDLREQGLGQYSQRMLGIAQQIHEVKKDSQRILAGLLKLYDNGKAVHMSVSEVIHFAIRGNRKYGEMLGKRIQIRVQQQMDCETAYYIPLLTVVNNLLANAVEAVDKSGTIDIRVLERGENLHVTVMDSGKGIPAAKREVIFEPGYTTKFNEAGIAATGIGLSHVRDIVQSLGGSITVSDGVEGEQGAKFDVCIPKAKLLKSSEMHDTFGSE